MTNPNKEFSIKNKSGSLALTFTVSSAKEENVNAFVIKDKFMQACGWYSGVIKVAKRDEEPKYVPFIISSASCF